MAVSSTSSTSLTLSTTTSSALGSTHLNSTVGGLDIDALVSATIAAKSLPITLMQNKNAVLQAKINDYTTIKTALKTLQYAAKDLTYESAFSGRTATSSKEEVVTASATSGGTTGSYTIEVKKLATITSNASLAIAATDGADSDGTKATLTGSDLTGTDLNAEIDGTTIKAGSFYINGKSIAVTTTDTINTIANKITASGAGVKATVGTDGKIILEQKTVGASGKITLGEDTTGFLTATGLTASTLVAGKDAVQKRTLDDVYGAGAVAKGYFSINGTFFAVDPSTDTVESIVKKINASTTAGVSAFFDSTTHQISLTSKTAGDEKIVLGTDGSGGTDSSNFLATVGLLNGSARAVDGKVAEVTVNGVTVTPVDNKITFQGNTFNLVGTGTSTVTVSDDIDAMVTKVQNFITAYNAAMDSIISKVTEKSDSSSTDASVGDLFGDSTLRGIEQAMRDYSSKVLSSQASTMQQLSQVGITTGKAGVYDLAQIQSGHLELDATKLRAALASDPKAVQSLFGNTTVSVDSEEVGTGNGSDKTFTLKYGTDIIGDPVIKVNGVSYTLVKAADMKDYATSPNGTQTNVHQFSFDSTTGKITLNTVLTSSDEITADYDYDASSGSGAGIFVQMGSLLTSYTQYGGMIDAIIGDKGNLAKGIAYNNERITDMKYRLSQEQATLYTKYHNMQTTLQGLQSQGSYITALLASLTKSSS
ncbi:flagellar filament capping protein FliD [Pelosinus propionicus]|uniref:Flagellar hook-associated protein 2 n=1 Tax=Pelosinus propionicus DSM 13327 TaxID=1123291 RepID=A0A1I4HT93_9FIRM|nr:flagellar filament capping protein FliD [Pelosinus propionicus]SFL45007.1 flagellar hook-associated protein 2 [Pelosinus propionicus DSM 13327]